MDRTTYTLAITSLLLLSACTSKDNNVGTVLTDGGSAGGAAHTGGTTTAQGGTVGGGGSGGGSSTAGCVYQGVSYAMGESFKADCNVCTCGLLGDNHVSCSLAVCLTDAGPPPSMGGGGAGGAQADQAVTRKTRLKIRRARSLSIPTSAMGLVYQLPEHGLSRFSTRSVNSDRPRGPILADLYAELQRHHGHSGRWPRTTRSSPP